jgi:hypothetical protein
MSDLKIYCPKCEYEPDEWDLWSCSCGHAWHTFDTCGKCPQCAKVWLDTACPSCSKWSKHHDWYHNLPPVNVEEDVLSFGA